MNIVGGAYVAQWNADIIARFVSPAFPMTSSVYRNPISSKPTDAPPRIEYRAQAPDANLGEDVLFAVEFGFDSAPVPPRRARVRLKPLSGAGLIEVWHATGPVSNGFDGEIRYAADTRYLAGAIEVDENACGGLEQATVQAYQAIDRFQQRSGYPHLLRIWNYLDAINEGVGDSERYRVFCQGRKAGLPARDALQYPAATAIGRRDGARVLQVYWLAGRVPGVALENPRQVSAYEYPRQYGPSAPTFSRAMQLPRGLLMISGTASIVGHATRHEGSVQRQLNEIFSNLDSLMKRAHAQDAELPTHFTAGTLIKAYLRDARDAPWLESELAARLPAGTPFIVLEADVCRADLLVELDCLHARR
jgi:chorismate lyase / 3-hydroxybenzoate synthase